MKPSGADRFGRIVSSLQRYNRSFKEPAVTQVASGSSDPFRILVSCLLSLRTKDETTGAASQRLFALAGTPEAMCRLSLGKIEKAIYPVGFYRNKAKTIKQISRELLRTYGGKVPDDIDELLRFKGVGRKTANLVVTMAFKKPGICVDTHVHRISNRLGFVQTRTPEETEMALRAGLPRKYWLSFNDLLVTHGQNTCKPISPLCSRCPLGPSCPRIGVTRSR